METGASSQDALKNKIMILYIKPHDGPDSPSTKAWVLVSKYPEILVQDALQVHPRPAWLVGVPTIFSLRTQQIFHGNQALAILQAYDYQQQVQSGAQSNMILTTSMGNHMPTDYQQPFAADKFGIPVGSTSGNVTSAGNFETLSPVSDERYLSQGKLEEKDLAAYEQRRKQSRKPVTRYQPSVLGNGELVTM